MNVEHLLDGRRTLDKRELTTALVELVRSKADLGAAHRRRANRILARPSDGGGLGAWRAGTAALASCSTHFCVHWDTAPPDAPPATDADGDAIPDFVEFVATSLELSYAAEVGTLKWTAPLPDGGQGGSDLVDVYLSDIGDDAYGYAVPESSARSTSSYLVLDNDYSATQFPDYGGDYAVPVRATTAHEFNHALQFVYDNYQDKWMMEATATWAEEKVFDDANDYRTYLTAWAANPGQPITENAPKMYGSAIWNHWLDGRYGAQVVRRAWSISQANSVDGVGFAPGAYDRAIKDSCGPGFAFEFSDFTAAAADWDATNSGIREGASFPNDVEAGDLGVNGPAAGGTLDHTAFAVFDVTPTPSGTLYLTGGLPAGVTGSIALVGVTPAGIMTKSLGILDANGHVTVSLADAGDYDHVFAVVTNADTSHAPNLVGSDWTWLTDGEDYTLTATTTQPAEPAAAPLPSFTPCTPPEPEPTPTPTASPTAAPTVNPPPPPPPPPATSLRLSRGTSKLATVARTGVLPFFARTNKAGRLMAKATVDRVTAARLRVGRRTTTVGTGRRTATAPARLKVTVRLTKKLRSALKRYKNRRLTFKVQVTFMPRDGTATVHRTITLRLKR